MACYQPLKGFWLPGIVNRPPQGWPNKSMIEDPDHIFADQLSICSNKVVAIRKSDHKKLYNLADVDPDEDYQKFVYLPCRKCYGCREDSAKMWTDRLMLELQNHDDAWFVTLTYDDDHLPMCFLPNEDGVVPDMPTLRKKDVQDFMKRLRKYFSDRKDLYPDVHIMYYLAGEYGGETKRPHYHAIIYGLPLTDLVDWKRRSGFVYYSSKFLEDTWQNGFVSVSKVNRTTAAYTCRYVMKKAMGDDAQVYLDSGREPEFQLMSKRPAIARTWYDQNVAGRQDDFYVNSVHYLTGPDAEPISFSIPRYFDVLTEKENADILVSVKKKRKKLGVSRQKALESQSSKRYEDILSDIEAEKKASNINFGKSSKGGLKL